MSTIKHPVVIIGAGFSGIICLKICLENGLDAIVYEKTENFGGLWRFRESDQYGIPSVQRSTTINTSKELSAFSDFPPPAELANFMHNSLLLGYLEKYMKHFQLEKYIKYHHQVLKVDKDKDYAKNGQWNVKIKNKEGEETEVTASGVMVCIGHHVFPSMATFPGLEDFKGTVMHSHSFKDYKGLENKQALVVGVGNSGMDVAVELSNVNTKVFLSTRRGAWVIRRVGATSSLPFDYEVSNRMANFVQHYFPNFYEKVGQRRVNGTFDHAMYNLKPKHKLTAQHPTISDAIPCKLLSGSITVKGDVDHFTPTGVVFRGEEEREYPIDAAILATGYKIFFPLLEEIIPAEKNEVGLYMRMFPVELEHPTLSIIGLIQPLGCIFPISEIQARWACQLIKGERKLPSLSERKEEVRNYKKSLEERYVPSQRHTIQVDFIPYMDSLAEQVGCKPNLLKIALTDPRLFFTMFFGPTVPYQYRLSGPQAWKGAREAILTVMDRTTAALNTRHGAEKSSQNSLGHLLFFAVLFIIVAILFFKVF